MKVQKTDDKKLCNTEKDRELFETFIVKKLKLIQSCKNKVKVLMKKYIGNLVGKNSP